LNFLINFLQFFKAAHCIYEFEDISVYIGVTNRVSGPAVFTQDITDKSHLILHESYNPTGHTNDIALVFLSTLTPDVFDSPRVALMTLPTKNEADVNLVGMEATVAGFGSTSDTSKASEMLRFVTMPIIENVQCRQTFGSFVRATNLCMSGKGGRSVCSGDSGGPLTVEMTPGVVVQVGIVSFGHK
jgi:chymotrypsin